MTRVRYPAEFKAEAVPQVIERGDGAAQGTCLRRDACVLGRRRSRWPAPGTHLHLDEEQKSNKERRQTLTEARTTDAI